MRDFLLRWWPTVLVLAAVLWLTLAPHPVPETRLVLFPGADKVVHALMMGGLTGAVLYDASRRGGWRIHPLRLRLVAVCTLLVAAFAAVDEWAQGAMGMGRTSDFYDLLADWAGILVVACVSVTITGRR